MPDCRSVRSLAVVLEKFFVSSCAPALAGVEYVNGSGF